MIFFITFLRALAACLITNAHYTGVYPTDLIANGGLLGDVIFFAVLGYCLCNIKTSFPKWYGKRLFRCYLPVLIMTGIYCIFGFYTFEVHNAFWWFVYPTNYHFVASIILLYIPYYIIMKIRFLRDHLLIIFFLVALLHLIVYCFFYDKSYYHIDTVREPMIWFLFIESMLIGAWFRQQDNKIRNAFRWYYPITMFFMLFLYFASKIAFSKWGSISKFQIINQLILLCVLISIFVLFASLDKYLEKIPRWIKMIITFIAKITLEIYVVQYVLIDSLRSVGRFPLNWLLITASILATAIVLHFICKGILHIINIAFTKVKHRVIKK